jgi:DinB superfamily
MVEPWLRGTLAEEDAVLRGVLHALELAREDVARWCSEFTVEQLEARPFGLPSVAFQMRHIARSLDRLLTYAEDRRLSDAQLEALENEMEPSGSREKVVAEFEEGINSAVRRIKAIPPGSYEKARWVGRGELPSSVGGLLVHCADHAQRHVGQLVTTAKVVVQLRGAAEDSRRRRRADERGSANPPEPQEGRSEGVS